MGSPTFEGFHSFTQHADYVTISTGKRSNFIYDADLTSGAVRLTFNKSTATSYEVRNYDGEVLASGAISGSTLDIPDTSLTWRGEGPYGWYRVYLFGPSQPNWGTAYGDCTFYRVRVTVTAAAFPANPPSGTAAIGANGNDEIAHGVMGIGCGRVNATIADMGPWGNSHYAASTGTSVGLATGSLGNGLLIRLFHAFEGDPSEIATPTTSGATVTWTLDASHTYGTLTVTEWRGVYSGAANPGTITVSSGTKSGNHWLYHLNQWYGDLGPTVTVATNGGNGETASVSVVDQGFPAGRQMGVFAFVVVGAPKTFSAWTETFSPTAWSRNPSGTQPASPNSRISVATAVFIDDSAVSPSVSWVGATDWAMIAIPACGFSSPGLPVESLNQTATYWSDNALSLRPRKTVMLFDKGIQERTSLIPNMLTVTNPDEVAYSPFNEPGLTKTMADYVSQELAPFYTAVKAYNPDATVLGWSSVSYNTGALPGLAQFIAANGLDYCDAIDIHAYNTTNGDLSLTRSSFEGLHSALDAAGFTGELWQTEQGFGWEYLGQTWPRWAGRWTALWFFVAELYGIPIERNNYWYDIRHGFDSFPMWWLSSTGPGPQALPIRTMADEIGNRTLSAQLDFGDGQQHYAGGEWVAGDGSKTLGIIAGSYGLPAVRLATSAASLTVVDCWGNTRVKTSLAGVVELESSEMPQWVRVPAGTTCALIPGDWDWGPNQALTGVPSTTLLAETYGSITDITDGELENHYAGGGTPLPWTDKSVGDTAFPVSVQVAYSNLVLIDRILIDCIPPWQAMTAPLDFQIEVFTPARTWETVYSYAPPPSTSFYFTSLGRCRAETFWDQRSTWIVEMDEPIAGSRVRVTVNDVSEGPHESDVWANNGQTGVDKRLSIRTLQTYGNVKRTVIPIR